MNENGNLSYMLVIQQGRQREFADEATSLGMVQDLIHGSFDFVITPMPDRQKR
jgi:hypothetical protein